MTPYHESEYHDAMLWAFNLAADSVDEAEYMGAETRAEVALHRKAAMDVAQRIQRMAYRYMRKHMTAKAGAEAMTLIKHRRVSRTRAPNRCQWCYESIDIGQPMDVQLYTDSHGHFCEDRYHPECWAAFGTLPIEEQESWSPGDFLRGCTCEAGTQCRCRDKERQ